MISMGIDIGSSSVKVALLDVGSGREVISAQYPEVEMPIKATKPGWAEQDPDMWYNALLQCVQKIKTTHRAALSSTRYIGISYQMHGLVCIDKKGEAVRDSIIWCDSRAVGIGENVFHKIGKKYCLTHFLNSPGNFTASKLRWVKENEPEIFARIHRVMLPGDYIGFRLTGEVATTISGLSEGIMWDFTNQDLAAQVLEAYELDRELIPDYHPSFYSHGQVAVSVAEELGISPDAQVYYKAGDQPNNALSLNVLKPGEVAATAGTSGVVYAVTDGKFVDYQQRVNGFAHVNYTGDNPLLGILLCINGVGISNSWVKRVTGIEDYPRMNGLAEKITPGSEGLLIHPFGNGAERMLQNKDIGASIMGLNFNLHGPGHLGRAVQEGVAYAFYYGMECFLENNIDLTGIKAGTANMFLSPIFRQVLADLSGVTITLYDTDGSLGAARGAVIGAGIQTPEEAFQSLNKTGEITPGIHGQIYHDLFADWKTQLLNKLNDFNS